MLESSQIHKTFLVIIAHCYYLFLNYLALVSLKRKFSGSIVRFFFLSSLKFQSLKLALNTLNKVLSLIDSTENIQFLSHSAAPTRTAEILHCCSTTYYLVNNGGP